MGMRLSGKDFEHGNATALSFRKSIIHEANKVAELVEKTCCEMFDLEFQEVFSSSVQDLATSAIPKELEVDKVEPSTCQVDKVGSSAVGELTRTANKAKLLFIRIVDVLRCFNLNHMHFFNRFRK